MFYILCDSVLVIFVCVFEHWFCHFWAAELPILYTHVELNTINSYNRHGQNIKKTWYWWRDITFLLQVVVNLASTVNLYLSWRMMRAKLMGHWQPSWKFWNKSIICSLMYFPLPLYCYTLVFPFFNLNLIVRISFVGSLGWFGW